MIINKKMSRENIYIKEIKDNMNRIGISFSQDQAHLETIKKKLNAEQV